MPTFCFLILHYNTLEETEACIASIKALHNQNSLSIMLVDNHSPNGSGKILLERYANDPQIEVLLLKDNLGFSKGNNAGCIEAVNKWNPDYLIVANNDIVFPQPDFLEKISISDAQNTFDVLGPDIYDPFTKIHQNPMGKDPPNLNASRKTILFNSLALAFFPATHTFLEKTVFSENSRHNNYNFSSLQHDPVLQGSCMVYSRKYLALKLTLCNYRLFYPETYFFYEEYIQTIWCRRNSCHIVYDPSLLVHHMGGRATASAHIDNKARVKFHMTNIKESAKIYRSFLKGKNEKAERCSEANHENK